MALNMINGESASQIVKTTLLIAVVLVFIVLISIDAVKALRRSAHWIPGDFLVLSALSIQLLNLLSDQGLELDVKPGANILWNEFWMIHTSRLMLCVVVAYMIPGMANPGSEDFWGKLMALALTIFIHVTSELYIVHRRQYFPYLWFPEKEISEPLYVAFATLISISLLLLILLLASANIAGRGIERIVAQKIPVILKTREEFCPESADKPMEPLSHPHHHHHHHHSPRHLSLWEKIQNAVLTSRAGVFWRTVKDKLRMMNTGDADHHQTCRRIVEDSLQRAEMQKIEKQDQRSCWRTNKDGEQAEQDHHYNPRCQYCWRSVEDAVLRAWIVARAYSLEYIIARSVLTSSAATIVTFQIVITIVGVLRKGSRVEAKGILDWLRCTATILQCVFIFIGWLIIFWRWATAAAYYRKWQTDTWRSGFWIEDFWTRHLRELKEAQESRLPQAQLLDNKIKGLVAEEEITLTAPKKLLSVVIGLQWLIVSFSKVCWLTSLMIFRNKLMGKFMSCILSKHEESAFQDYPKYRNLLEGVQMLRETPASLWLANHKSIVMAKSLIFQGNGDGYGCECLVEFVAKKKTGCGAGCHCLEPYKPQANLRYLCKKRPIHRTHRPKEKSDVEEQQSREEKNEPLAVEEHFTDVSTKSWKMTAVSLLGIIIHLVPIYAEIDKKHCSASHALPPKAVKDCLEAYSQAWEIIDFVEETGTVADGITSQAADMYFCNLQKKMKDEWPLAGKFRHATPECMRAALDDLKMQCKRKTEPHESVNLVTALIGALGEED